MTFSNLADQAAGESSLPAFSRPRFLRQQFPHRRRPRLLRLRVRRPRQSWLQK